VVFYIFYIIFIRYGFLGTLYGIILLHVRSLWTSDLLLRLQGFLEGRQQHVYTQRSCYSSEKERREGFLLNLKLFWCLIHTYIIVTLWRLMFYNATRTHNTDIVNFPPIFQLLLITIIGYFSKAIKRSAQIYNFKHRSYYNTIFKMVVQLPSIYPSN